MLLMELFSQSLKPQQEKREREKQSKLLTNQTSENLFKFERKRDGELHKTALAGRKFQRGIAKHRNDDNPYRRVLLQSRKWRAWPDLSVRSNLMAA